MPKPEPRVQISKLPPRVAFQYSNNKRSLISVGLLYPVRSCYNNTPPMIT